MEAAGFLKTKNINKLSKHFFKKMVLIENYTCPRSINEKSHLCLAKYL